ncbi:unnamed protein product [Moneuplotes crassus]|uniref:Uncharacterized protein n=1 Tax=Euplotes crassus TaxID=5936 RepID=A0AAD1X587_EUPCR|nr:unnamed protein product [Moneuplotes crassus]
MNNRNTFGKLHGVVKSGRKEVSSKIIKISEPLLAKNVRFECNFTFLSLLARENQRKTIERTLNESTISHFGTDINTIETNLDQISGEEIIKSVVCRNIAKEQKNDLEERKNKIIMKNQNKSDLLKEEQSKTPEIIFKEKIPILTEKKEAAVQELHKTPDQDPNPEKYNEYMVNHYSLPKKLRSSIRKISPPKEFKKIGILHRLIPTELKSTEHLNSKLSRSWMLYVLLYKLLGSNPNVPWASTRISKLPFKTRLKQCRKRAKEIGYSRNIEYDARNIIIEASEVKLCFRSVSNRAKYLIFCDEVSSWSEFS